MVFPIIVLLYFFLLYSLYDISPSSFKDRGIKGLTFLISFLLLQLLRLYCQDTFPDIPNYKDVFNEIKPLTYVIKNKGTGMEYYDPETMTQVDFGFRFFISIFKVLSGSYSTFLIFVSIIELWSLSFFCRRFKISLLLIMPIYIALTYTAFQIGMLRQALAFCIFLISLCYIQKLPVYLFLVILGCFFHKSMIFCIFFFWCNKKVSIKYIHFLFLLSLMVYLLRVNYVGTFWNMLSLTDMGRVNHYLDNGVDMSFLGVGFWERVILYVLMVIVYTKSFKAKTYDPKHTLIFNLGVSLIIFQLFFFASPTITSRLRYYIVIFPLLYLVLYMRENIRNKQLKVILYIPLVLYLCMYIFTQSGYLRGF